MGLRVGDEPVPQLRPVRHRVPMMSIDNTYSAADLAAWGRRVEKLLADAGSTEPIEWVLELKIDGVAMSLTYDAGALVLAALLRGGGGGAAVQRCEQAVRVVDEVAVRCHDAGLAVRVAVAVEIQRREVKADGVELGCEG